MTEPAAAPAPAHTDTATADYAVAVVGGGPAGLAAAIRLRALGIERVVVLDREPAAGGIPRHCGHYPFGLREFRRLYKGPDYAARLVAEARAAGVDILTDTTVVRLAPGPLLTLSTPAGTRQLSARRVILATGVRESSRAARMIGGQRPLGVISTGALQSMVYLQGLAPFARPVILGTELVSFSAILTCRHAGIRPAAMIEANGRVTARAFARGLPLLLGIPLLLDSPVERIVGDRRVEAVVVRQHGGTREIACDGVIVSGTFTPEASLARAADLAIDPGTGGPVVDQYGRCSDPDVFATGNLLRPVETAGWSWREGTETADRVAASLAGTLPNPAATRVLHGEGDALRFVMPQRLAPAAGDPLGMGHAQVRVTRPVTGTLSAWSGDRMVWSRRLSALPERRLLVPLAPLQDPGPGGNLRITLTEEA